MLNITQNTARE